MSQPAARTVHPLAGPTGRLVAAHRDELRAVLRRHGAERPRIFGSVARGDDHIGSDLDILLTLPTGTGLFAIARLQAELEEILGVAVDLVPEAGLKPLVRTHIEPELVDL